MFRSRAALVGSALASLLVIGFAAVLFARCGVERWSVKTGTDADIALIDVSHVTPTTIAALGAIPAPAQRPDNNRISPTETTVFQIEGRLVKYKFENSPTTGDSDYHLVIHDENQNSIIVEIPFPDCVDQASRFFSAIEQTRARFDSAFTATGSFKTANVPVRVIGVGFFDRPHNATGPARNFIELHPVLSIEFNPPGGGELAVTRNELIQDGGFEEATTSGNGAPGWNGSTNGNQAVIVADGIFPHEGHNYAFFGKANNLNARLSQTIEIPTDAPSASLTFWINVVTNESPNSQVFDRLKVEVRRSSGQLLAIPLTLSNRDASKSNNTSGQYFQAGPIDLSQFAGSTVKVVFHATTDGAKTTSFRVDDVSLSVDSD